MDIRYIPTPDQLKSMNTMDIRQHFLLENLFSFGQIRLVYSHVDRMIVGGVVPDETPNLLRLEATKELAADYFAERRETGVFNLGGNGMIRVDGTVYPTRKYEMVYISRGSQVVEFSSEQRENPARFYLVSLPAHTHYPTSHIRQADAKQIPTGSPIKANDRVIHQYIHSGGAQSCQLVMGFTQMKAGSVWNTMPPHLHDRRSEVYLYFDLHRDAVVFHLMGQPHETRHVVMRDGDAILSPSWSIHAGVGTEHYAFVWAMGGENQDFADIDNIALTELA